MAPRFFLPEGLAEQTEFKLPEPVERHVRVLRLHVGDAITLFDGQGGECPAEILSIDRREVRVRTQARLPIEREIARHLRLAPALIAAERFDWMLQKAVELGVAEITPVLTQHSQRLPGPEGKRLAHWQGVIIAAAEQCGRNRLPALHAPRTLSAWLEAQPAERTLVLLDAEGSPLPPHPSTHPTILVGPEGGFSAAELEALRARASYRLRLGPTILRAETAAVAAVSVLTQG